MSEEYKKIQQASTNGRLKFLLKDSVIYGGVSSLSKFLHIFLLPILTRYISKSDFGIYDTLLTISAFVIGIVIAGTDSSVARFFYDTKDLNKQKVIVSEVLFFELAMSMLICAILWLFSPWILVQFFENTVYLPEMHILIFTIPFIALVRYTQNLLKWIYKRTAFIIVSAGSVSLNLLLAIFFILYIDAEIKYLFYSQLISMIIFAILGLYYSRHYIIFPQKFTTLLSQLKFGIPLSANQILSSFIPNIERYIIATLLGTTSLGMYAVGNKISQLSQMVINGFQVAWGPLVYSIMNEKNSDETYIKVFNYYLLFTALFILIFVFFIPIFINILATNAYHNAQFVIFILLTSKMILSITGITGIGLELAKKTNYYLIASSIQLTTTLLFLYFLTPILGINGVALSVLVGSILYSVILTVFSYQKSKIKFNYLRGIVLLMLAAIFSLILIENSNWILKTILLIIFLLIIFTYTFFALIEKTERNYWKQKLNMIQKKAFFRNKA